MSEDVRIKFGRRKENDRFSVDYAYGLTDRGRRRPGNEDMIFFYDAKSLGQEKLMKVGAVADGVGGIENGEQASGEVISFISRKVMKGERVIRRDLMDLHRRMSSDLNGPATTLVLAQAYGDGNSFQIFSAGDSPAYVINTKSRVMREITSRDEVMEMRNGRRKMVVTKAIGKKGYLNAFGVTHVTLREGEGLLLASDGLTDYIDSGAITTGEIFRLRIKHEGDERGFVKALVDLANSCGGKDNISVVSIPYDDRSK